MRSRIFQSTLLLLGVASLTGLAPAQPSEAEFTRQMAERFRAALPGHAVEVTSEPLQLRIAATPEPVVVNVGRIYNYCASAPARDCAESIDRLVSGTLEGIVHPPPPVTRAQLRLLVRNVEYCDSINPDHASDLRGPITRPFVSGLCIILMADYPTTMRSVSEADLGRLTLTPDAAWALAERQTLADLPHPEAIEGLRSGIAVVTGFDYVTSLLMNREGWRAATAAQGELIVAVPASDTLVVARRDALGDLAGFRATVRQHFETAERGVSPNLYHWTAAGWALLE